MGGDSYRGLPGMMPPGMMGPMLRSSAGLNYRQYSLTDEKSFACAELTAGIPKHCEPFSVSVVLSSGILGRFRELSVQYFSEF